MSLETPDKIRSLQRKLYCKAKAEPAFRFSILYDKICREDILAYAYELSRSNAGAPGVDGVTFEQIDAAGVEAWLAGLREDLVSKRYRPDPVRRATIPKPGAANARSASRRFGIGWFRPPPTPGLDPGAIFEADFEDSAYGYRPRRSAAKQPCRRARVGSGMIACSREATSWRNKRHVSGRVRRPAPGPRPSVESPRVRRRAARAEG